MPPAAAAPPSPAKVNAQVPAANPGSCSSDSSLLPIDPRLFDASLDLTSVESIETDARATAEERVPTPEPDVSLPPSPPPQQVGSLSVRVPASSTSFPPLVEATHLTPSNSAFTAPAPTLSTTPATEPDTIAFDFEEPERRIAKPKSRLRRLQAQASAAVSAKAPAPVPFVAPSAPALAPAPPPPPPPAPILPSAVTVPAPVIAPASSSSASDKGKGKASSSPAEAEPVAEWDFAALPGEYLRSLCEDWVSSCAVFMSESPLCANLSPSWIRGWKQRALLNLGEELSAEVDEVDFDHDEAASTIKRFFQYNLLRRMDGPVKDGKNAILRHVKGLVAKEGIDLGQVEVQ